MSISQKKSLTSGLTQLTVQPASQTGTRWIECSTGKYIKFGVSDGHGASYDIVTRLAPEGARDSKGDAITGLVYEEQTGLTGGNGVKFNPGIAAVGVRFSGAGTSDMIIELQQGAN